MHGASKGIELCIRSVIPSLFPFFILTGILGSTILGQKLPLFLPIRKWCRIPAGAESVLLLGLLTGYPTGAHLVGQADRNGNLTHNTAVRMVAFCNNAGPAFIFGILSGLFTFGKSVLFLWGIQIISALLVARLLPSNDIGVCNLGYRPPVSITMAMERAIKTIASVCGWIIIFRIILNFCQTWFLWRFPVPLQILFSGLLELSNGCIRLNEIQNEGLRFILAGFLLSAGGVCITMQTLSLSQNVFTPVYFLGKGMQVTVTSLLSIIAQMLLFSGANRLNPSVCAISVLCFSAILSIFLILRKKF